MKLKKAIEILEQYNNWRLGKEKAEFINPSDITESIGIAIHMLKEIAPSEEVDTSDISHSVYSDIVVKSVCKVFQIEQKELSSKSRKRHLVEARQMCYYMVHNKYNHYSIYGQKLEQIINRDRTTCIHSVKTAEMLVKYDTKFITKYNKVNYLVEEEMKELIEWING